MSKKTQKIEPERLVAIENRLLHLELFLHHVAFLGVPPIVWWSRHLSLRQAFPTLPLPPALGIPREIKVLWREMGEMPVEPWKYLVRRAHPWRKQLYIQVRNLTARQLVGGIKANRFDDEKAAANYQLPIEAIQEALAYVEKNKELLETEAEIERLMLKRGGVARGPQPVSG